jgi:hypothetical protein
VTARGAFARLMRAAVGTTALALTGCDATSTSIGAWLPEASTGFYLEAESGQLSGGFTIGQESSASAGGCIEPPAGSAFPDEPGPARARYTFDVATRGTYLIWGRIHSPDASHNRFWFQLDGGRWFIWRITTGEDWYWAALHENASYGMPLEFHLDVGAHELLVANATDQNRLDRFYFTADGDEPPGNDSPCKPPHSVRLSGSCVPSCGSQGGNRCGPIACQGQTILPAHDCDICCKVP